MAIRGRVERHRRRAEAFETTRRAASGRVLLGIALVVVMLATACNGGDEEKLKARQRSAAPSPSGPAAPSPTGPTVLSAPQPEGSACAAPVLAPAQLPGGMNEVFQDYIVSAEWWRTWARGERWVQVLGGIDEAPPGGRGGSATVRGKTATAGAVPGSSPPVLLIDWEESTPCGAKRYGVAGSGVAEAELLQVAGSLAA